MTDLVTFWGCELKGSTKEATWAPGRGEDTQLDDGDEVMLSLSQACVGVSAKETEWNVVDVATKDRSGEDVQHTIVQLKRSAFPHCPLSILLTSEATFKLVQGNGPVHITGEERISFDARGLEVDDESDEEEMETFVIKDQNVVDGTKNKNNLSAAATYKASPGKDSKPTKQLPTKYGTVMKDNLISNEAEEDDDDSDEEEASGDEGSGEDSDEEDSDDNNDDDEEKIEAPPMKKKKTSSQAESALKGSPLLAKKKHPDAASQTGKAKQQGSAKTPTGSGQTEIQKLKEKLLQSPQVPKKKDKFYNFLKHTHKLQDIKTQNEVWGWWQQQKKTKP
ncbi:nucleoplasmin-like protein ANO39 [Corticium candelabrum]|uniref:nucleoplasmin-like protein ANO39 n=1 Tax=Corticium candelabrum TaxID=121492 RepID=UPI002E274740|nr:nucleoplasmin-like protein ANO39 [Corticium candelabrum]